MKARSMAPKIFLTVFLTAVLLQTPAEEPSPMLLQVLQALEEHHPAFAANEAALAAAEAGYSSGRGVLKPQVELSTPLSGTDYLRIQAAETEVNGLYSVTASPQFSGSYLLPSGGNLSVSLSDSLQVSNYDGSPSPYSQSSEAEWANTLAASLGIRQPLVFRGVYDATVSRLETAFNTEAANYLSIRNSLVLQALNDFYEYKLSVFRVDLVRWRQKNDQEMFRRVEREFEMGLWSKGTLVQAQASLLQTEADLLKAEQALTASLRRLSSFYGLEPADETAGEIVDLLERADQKGEDLIETALRDNPDLVKLRNSLAGLEADRILQAKNHAPSIDAGVSYSYNRTLQEDPAETHSISFNVGFHASLADGGTFQDAQRQLGYQIEGLSARLREEEKSLQHRVQTLTDTIERNTRLAELYTLQEEAARFDYESGQKDFEMGQITSKDLMERQVHLENITLTIQSNTIERNMALLELYALTGIDMFQWLRNRIKEETGL
ncbi:MAG: TolC family protein [Spirochaetales bacterium]|nr:TolC family protein [Spirochaetales bacterium]